MRLRLIVTTAHLGALTMAAGCSSAAPAVPPASPVPPTPTAAPAATAVVGPTDIADRMEQVLTGTVERSGSCTLLLAGDRRLPLVGGNSLDVGARVTVRGIPVPVPVPCSGVKAGHALQVTTIRPA